MFHVLEDVKFDREDKIWTLQSFLITVTSSPLYAYLDGRAKVNCARYSTSIGREYKIMKPNMQ